MLFWGAFSQFAAVYLPFLMKNDPDGFKDAIRTKDVGDLLDSYDFIVVGAGSAGSVVASRLSENDKWKILLIEAGGQENHFSRTPKIFSALLDTPFNWNYTTTPQKKVCKATNGVCPYPRGRALGGSSSVNGMVFVRGYASDYDRWGKDNPGWSFADLHPYFLKSQDNRISGLTERGTKGPLTVSYPSYKSSADDLYIQAGKEMGWAHEECMNYENDCMEFTQMSIRDGRRCSTSTAFLEQAHTRDNLHILTDAFVTKVLTEGKAASGVEFKKAGKMYSVRAGHEVILSLGAIDSPKMLMLSGVGPREHLESLGIAVKENLPVGNNLQDHFYTFLSFNVDNGTTRIKDLENSMDEYVQKQTGPLSTDGFPVMSYSTLGKPGTPVVQHIMGTVADSEEYRIQISTAMMRPQSRGTIRLSSADPEAKPLIDSNAYSHENDIKTTINGTMEAIKFMNTDAMKRLKPKISPDPACNKTEPVEEFITCMMELFTEIGHPTGTVKMAPKDKEGVVDNRLKVYGMKKLRVIDASIAPSVVSVNTNAMAIMIGERGSDIIKEDYNNEKNDEPLI